MSSNSPEPTPSRPGGLQSMLARLKGMVQSIKPAGDPEPDEILPTWDTTPPPPAAAGAEAAPEAEAAPAGPPAPGADGGSAVTAAEPAPPAAPALCCPVCGSPHDGGGPLCLDCGYYFSPADLARAEGPAAAAEPAGRLQDRFELGERLGEHAGVARFRGLDHGTGPGGPVPVVILRQELPPAALPEAIPEGTAAGEEGGQDVLPGIEEPLTSSAPITDILPARPDWPSVAWEHHLLETLDHPSLPRVVASFTDDRYEYLVEELPRGRSLWDAWDDPEATAEQRFGHLAEVAEALHELHHRGAMLEALRPDRVVVSDEGRARLADLSDLLPLPLPPGAPVRGTLYTAPEFFAANGGVDARAGLYSFGALLYSLHVGRELSDIDFDRPGHPKPFVPRFPDVHPAFGRLMMKTFRREVEARFPTDEAAREDPTGFAELIRTLRVLARTMDRVRMEVASWTTTGIVRTGNEDAFALLHACESRQDDLGECALVLLCDGMGGYEAGEVAAALAIQALRQNLVQQPAFAPLAGASSFPTDVLSPAPRPEGHAGPPADVEAVKQAIKAALKEANKQVFAASRAPGSKRRGMGCTAEVVYLDGRNVIVGHVGDSRTYHLHEGRLIQMTRDQTLVNRLVELGTLTPEEAETHPRRNELQQAVGGQPDVEPGLYHGVLKPGDWVVVCSDGVTNHVPPNDLKEMLQSEAQSAEMAARRLVNLTNIEGATDNATVVVVRAT
jgi:serine/threonine protein phosphatase PrpC